MLNAKAVRDILEGDGSESARAYGPIRLADTIYQTLGLMDVPPVGSDGRPTRRPMRHSRKTNYGVHRGHVLESQQATARPEDFSITAMAMGIFGGSTPAEAAENMVQQSRGYHGGSYHMHGARKAPMHDQLESVDALEAGTDITPSQFANISAFNAVTAGLYEAKILEVYQRPEFISEQLAKTEPSVRRAEKIVGISKIGDVAEERKPGNAHKRSTLSERFVTGPVTQNRGVGMDITREAVLFDFSKQLLQQAEENSEAMRMRREYLTLQTVLGVHNTYTYDGTNTNTYATGGNYINKLASNTLVDWSNLNGVEKLLTQMVDQETGQPINVPARQILVLPAKYPVAEYVMRFTQIERATSGAGNQGLNTSLSERGFGPNPYNGRYELLPSSIWVRRIAVASASASDAPGDPKGLGLTDSNADLNWWMGDFHRAFQYSQQLPLVTIRVDANNYEMADRGLVFSIFLDEMGTPMVKDPRYVVQSTN